MTWLVDAFWARIGWALGEVAIAATVVLLLASILFAFAVIQTVRQSRCRHLRYRETSACDAICSDCGKNLGFIGAVRDRRGPALPSQNGKTP